jgi:hypothetical protein
MDIYATYATDEDAEVNGVWQHLGDANLLIARANNPRYARMLTSLAEKHQLALDKGDDDSDALSNKLLIDVFAETILLGWENVSYNGESLPYTLENARKVLAHKDFRREVARLAESIDAYRVKVEEAQAKNL